MTEQEKALSAQRRKRGAIKASITRLQTKTREIEVNKDDPDSPAHARRMAEKLKELDSNFKEQHFAVLELLELTGGNDGEFDKEQEVLDKHEDEIAALTITLDRLIAVIGSSASPPGIDESHSAKKNSPLTKETRRSCLQNAKGNRGFICRPLLAPSL